MAKMEKPDLQSIQAWFMQLQDSICSSLEAMDGIGKFREDPWIRPGGGGGRTRIIEGELIEKGGVNYSGVNGVMPANIAKALGLPPNHKCFNCFHQIIIRPNTMNRQLRPINPVEDGKLFHRRLVQSEFSMEMLNELYGGGQQERMFPVLHVIHHSCVRLTRSVQKPLLHSTVQRHTLIEVALRRELLD